jgi:DNA polymerase-3 subunit epsilon/ATP-dependent DNA helicase DinG
MLLAVENSAHVVISTNTINLQQQLIDKDIPDLLRALGATLPLAELVAVPVKGRGNYLCLRRWSSLHHEWWLPPEEHRLLARIQAWLDVTQSGDRAELNLSGGEIPTWNKLCAQVDDCWAGNCPYYRRGNCFLFQARKAAEGAHLIVVNHALLLSELAAGTKVLPEYHYLIIDEAHHLEDEVTKQLGSQIGQPQLLNFLSRIEHKVDGQRYIGLLNQLRERLRLSTVMPLRRSHLEQLSDVLRHKANEPRAQALLFFDAARRFLQEHTEEQNLRLTTQVRRSRGWAEVQGLWDDLNLMLKDIEGTLNELYIGLEDLSDERFPDYDSLMLELSSLLHTDGELRRQINSVVSHPEENDIHWLSLRGEDGSVHLCTAPLKVGDILQQRLLCDKEGVVLSGATLSTEGNFNYIKERLGFGDVTEVLLGSPFDYHSAVLLYIAEDIPEPGEPGYQQAVERAIIELCLASEGRTLALFTSYSALKATLAVIRAPLEEKGILVLGQRVDGLPRQLLDSFRSESKAILLGTSSFWEGVDIVGEALSTLVMVRLPFNVPTEPVFAARSETFTDPFAQYALPQAALRFKQGFGRLIRSRSDRGVIAVLDSRLKHKGYGATFLKSIPQCTVISGCTKDLPKTTVEWLKGGSAHFPEVLHLSAEPNEI